MAEQQKYLGQLVFGSTARMHAAWESLQASHADHVLRVGHGVEITRRGVRFDIHASAPHTVWSSTLEALWTMAEHARAGVVRATLGKPTLETRDVNAARVPDEDPAAAQDSPLGARLKAGRLLATDRGDALVCFEHYSGTVLAACAHLGQLEALRGLLANASKGLMADALVAASAAGALPCIDALLEAGAPHRPNALLRAANRGTVERLLDAGFDPKAKGTVHFGGPLKAPRQTLPLVGILERLGAAREPERRLALEGAALALDGRAKRSSLPSAAVFSAACGSGSVTVIEAALRAGAAVNPKPTRSRSLPLTAAIFSRSPGAVAQLLEAGAQVDPRDVKLAREYCPSAVAALERAQV